MLDKFVEVRDLLGTRIKITAFGKRAETCIDEAFFECERIERDYSRFIENNKLAELNAKKGQWVAVDEELYRLVEFGVSLNRQTDGAFDLTVKSILEGWGYDRECSFQEKEEGVLGQTELKGGKIRLSAEIDLGGIGKGYALDRMVEKLNVLSDFCVNAGGDIFASGTNDGRPWRMYFEHPFDPRQAIGFVDFRGLALACSNPSKRRWRDRHHLVDPRTGMPADEMLAVYTQAKSGLIADAYATALFVSGYEKAKAMLEHLPVSAMLVSKKGAIFRSPLFKGELYTIAA